MTIRRVSALHGAVVSSGVKLELAVRRQQQLDLVDADLDDTVELGEASGRASGRGSQAGGSADPIMERAALPNPCLSLFGGIDGPPWKGADS